MAPRYDLKFAANISTMFLEEPDLAIRYDIADVYGFRGVECSYPYDYDMNVLRIARSRKRINHTLLNSYPGEPGNPYFGFATMPYQEQYFRESLELSLMYAHALECKKINIMIGLSNNEFPRGMIEDTVVNNLRCASELFEKFGVTGLIEPICPQVMPNYFLNNYDQALWYLSALNCHNIKLLLDVYSLRMTTEPLEISYAMRKYIDWADYVQIAQAPIRNEPSCPGIVNFERVFSRLQYEHYRDFVGLEYYPSITTSKSFGWLWQHDVEV